MSDPRDALVEGLAAIGGLTVFLGILAIVACAWPVIAFICLNFVAGLGLSFWQIVGIGWLAGAVANQ